MEKFKNLEKLIVLLMKYNSKTFIESVVALLDTEEEIFHLIHFLEDNPYATETDIYEEIIRLK